MSLRGEAPYADVAYGDFDVSSSGSVADALDTLLEQPWKLRSWWLRAKPRNVLFTSDPPTLIDVDLSTDGHRTFPTDAEEIQLDEALVQPYSLSFSLANKLWGVVTTDFGEIEIGDPRASRRSLAGEDWIGRQADVYLGPPGGTQVQFARVARLLSRQIRYNNQSLHVIVDDHSFLFNSDIQSNLFAGTGGLEGGTEIQGRPKPLLLGIARQFEPILVDGTNRIYQIHDGSMQAVDEVLDEGVALAFNADVADITTATPAPGEYATSLANGYIKLGSDPAGVVTCTARGHNSSAYGYVSDIVGLTKLLAVDFAGFLDPADLDPVAFSNLATHTAAMGAFVDAPATIGDVLARFHRSAASWAWLRPNKVLKVGRITDPDAATADFSIDASEDELRESPFDVTPLEIPLWRVRVGYRRYSRILGDSEMAASVPLATRKDYNKEYRFVQSSDAAILVQTPEAGEAVILTDLDTEADAQALADEQLTLRKSLRYLAVISPRTGLIKRGIGDVLELTYNRQHTSPKKWVIVGVRNAAASVGEEDEIVWDCLG